MCLVTDMGSIGAWGSLESALACQAAQPFYPLSSDCVAGPTDKWPNRRYSWARAGGSRLGVSGSLQKVLISH